MMMVEFETAKATCDSCGANDVPVALLLRPLGICEMCLRRAAYAAHRRDCDGCRSCDPDIRAHERAHTV